MQAFGHNACGNRSRQEVKRENLKMETGSGPVTALLAFACNLCFLRQNLKSRPPYFRRMVKSNEFRIGNYLLHKTGVRILTVPCTFAHFDLMAKDGGKDLFPVLLSPKILEGCGFVENKKYALLPESREFDLVLPVMGSGDVRLKAYVKANKECFARLMTANVPLSNNLFHLHSLQNLYHAFTGEEMAVKI